MNGNGSRIGRVLGTGFALAVTVGIGYIVCALVFRLWPNAAAEFMNSLADRFRRGA
jgi:hypothetical protein